LLKKLSTFTYVSYYQTAHLFLQFTFANYAPCSRNHRLKSKLPDIFKPCPQYPLLNNPLLNYAHSKTRKFALCSKSHNC